jgi:hypothetical protein
MPAQNANAAADVVATDQPRDAETPQAPPARAQWIQPRRGWLQR